MLFGKIKRQGSKKKMLFGKRLVCSIYNIDMPHTKYNEKYTIFMSWLIYER